MSEHLWIWQQPNWPRFHWREERLAPLIRACAKAQGHLLGMSAASQPATSSSAASAYSLLKAK
jgi:Fic family protein